MNWKQYKKLCTEELDKFKSDKNIDDASLNIIIQKLSDNIPDGKQPLWFRKYVLPLKEASPKTVRKHIISKIN